MDTNDVQITADGGSTKTEWRVTLPDGSNRFITTSGINPSVMPASRIRAVLNDELLPKLMNGSPANSDGTNGGDTPPPTQPDGPLTPQVRATRLRYFGAGVRPELESEMERHLREIVPLSDDAEVEVGSDLLGACHALFGNRPGIVGILGTGSNSCYYDGHAIVDQVPSLGYVLGDEGSGAFLGRWLLNSVFKRQLPESVLRAFGNAYPNLTAAEVVEKVYRNPEGAPNRYLASFAPFLAQVMWEPEVALALKNAFRAFFRRNLSLYSAKDSVPLGLIGSIAWYFSKPIRIVAREERFRRPTFRLSPLHPSPEE